MANSPMSPPQPVVRRVLFAALSLSALLALFVFKWVHADVAQGRRVGFSLIDTNHGLIIDSVVEGFPAA
jgi:hypothetical protein